MRHDGRTWGRAAAWSRLKDAVDQDAVRADLLGVVQRSLEPTHATVWVRSIR
jgi:hypothetical protein